MSAVLSRWRRGGRVVAGAGLVAAGLLAPGLDRAAGQQPPLGFSASAAADGVRVTIAVPNFVAADMPVDGGGPTAQAALDSFGTSMSFAAAPYPGDAGAGAPSLVAGFTGAPVPAYPLIATASYPATPAAHIGEGGYALDATAEATAAASTAVAGDGRSGSTGTRSHSSIERAPDGSVVAEATSTSDLVALGELELHGVRSLARVTYSTDGTVTREASLEFGTATLAGSPAGFGPGAIRLGDTDIPTAPVSDALLGGLAAAGYDLTVLAAEETDTSVLSPALKLTTTQRIPVADRDGTLTVIIGRTTAAVSSADIPSDPVREPALPTAGSGPAPDTAPPGAGTTGSSPGGTGRPASSASIPSASMPSLPAASAIDASSTSGSPAAALGVPLDLAGFYWILVVAGGVVIGGGEVLRTMGVRWP